MDFTKNLNKQYINGSWANGSFLIRRVTSFEFFGFFDKLLNEFVSNIFLNNNAIDGHANLTLVHKFPEKSCVNGIIYIGIFHHDKDIVST